MSLDPRKRSHVRTLTECAMIAALYAASTLVFAPICYGALQLRVSEALTLLPVLTRSGVVGLTVGCAIANGIGVALGVNSCGALDIIFGTLATLLAALMSRAVRSIRVKNIPLLSAVFPALFNGVIIGLELSYIYKLPFLLCALQVAGGELLVTLLLGLPLNMALERLGVFGNK